MRTVAIALEDVLRKPLDVEAQDFAASLLFASLVDTFRVVVLGTADPEKDKHFLGVNGMTRYAKIEPLRAEDGPTLLDQRVGQLRRLRYTGFNFAFVVIPDPALAEVLYRENVPVLLYLHPEYSPSGYRPATRPWSDLVAEVEFRRTARAENMEGSTP